MFYKNFVTRFILRKKLFKRIKYRLKLEYRKISKNEFSDIKFIFDSLGSDPKIIIDGGANVGFVTNQFCKLFPHSTIHAFEPNPSVFEQMQAFFKNNKKVVANNKGLGNKNDFLTFYKNNNTGTSSFLKPNDFHLSGMARKYVEVKTEVINLSDYLGNNAINEVDILKLDIEGFELKVLESLETQLRDNKIKVILTEVNLIATYDGQCLIEEIFAYLRKLNYQPYNIYGYNETNLRQSIITNLVFISQDVKEDLRKKYGLGSIG